MKILYLKNVFLFDFSLFHFIENHLFLCIQIIILFEEFGAPVFFFFKAL